MNEMNEVIERGSIDELLEIFRALSSKTRFDIVVRLIKRKESNVGEMAKALNIPQPNVSQHLTILKNAKIIEGFRSGTQMHYKVTNEHAKKIINAIESSLLN